MEFRAGDGVREIVEEKQRKREGEWRAEERKRKRKG